MAGTVSKIWPKSKQHHHRVNTLPTHLGYIMSRILSEDDELNEDKQEAEMVFQSFIERHHQDEIQSILMASNTNEHFTLNINALEFFDTNMHVGKFLLKRPLYFIPVFEESLRKTQCSIKESIILDSVSFEMSIKQNVHVRFSNLPVCPELARINVPKGEDFGKFIAFSGKI